jgi:hypothetical protein
MKMVVLFVFKLAHFGLGGFFILNFLRNPQLARLRISALRKIPTDMGPTEDLLLCLQIFPT